MKRTINIILALCLLAGLCAAPTSAIDDSDISAVFTDPNFLARVYQTLEKAPGEPIAATECAVVKALSLHDSGIASLAGIEYFTRLEDLNASGNALTALDISGNTRLKYLDISGNQLAALDISQNKGLEILNCSGNQLTALNVSYALRLEQLHCQNNQLTVLDIRNNARLTILDCYNNNMSSAFKVRGSFTLETAQLLSGNAQFKFYPQNEAGHPTKYPGYLFHAIPFYLFTILLFPLRLILSDNASTSTV